LQSPRFAKTYLVNIHKIAFPKGDDYKKQKWKEYPLSKGIPQSKPITCRNLSNTKFISEMAEKLSFDISRFLEFLSGYYKVNDNIKPIMLHYAMIYILDFFSRTWLKYGDNSSQGISLVPERPHSVIETEIQLSTNGIFPRAVDAFYLVDQSSLFSIDDKAGIGKIFDLDWEPSQQLRKIKYSEKPKIKLGDLIENYEYLQKLNESLVTKSNLILTGYAILFLLSSICRYRAADWFKVLKDRDLYPNFELLQHDFLYKWIPELSMQTILRQGLAETLPISKE
jgi:hypothetical protein